MADGTADFLTNGTTNKRDSTLVNKTNYGGAHYTVFRPMTAVYGTVWQKNPNAGKFTGIKNGTYKHSDAIVSIGAVPVNKPSIVGALVNRAT